MTLRWREDVTGTKYAVMDTCPACGAVLEWHYYKFARHVRKEHDAEDFGLPELPEEPNERGLDIAPKPKRETND